LLAKKTNKFLFIYTKQIFYLLFARDFGGRSVVVVDAIDDGDGVFTYELPFISFVRTDKSLSSNDILHVPGDKHLSHECLHDVFEILTEDIVVSYIYY